MRANPYRRPTTPQARRAEMMRATALRKRAGRRTAQLNDGYEDPYDLMMDVKSLAQDLGRRDVFLDEKAAKQLDELTHMVNVGLRWESDEDGEFDMDPSNRSRLEALSKAIDEALGHIQELNFTIGEVRL